MAGRKHPRTLTELRADPRVAELDREVETGFLGDGTVSYWLYLKPGFMCTLTECHLIHRDTVAEVADFMKSVVPCTCDDCKLKLETEGETK